MNNPLESVATSSGPPAVKAFKALNFKVMAAGDSYNDTAMLGEAHGGILFHPPENVTRKNMARRLSPVSKA